MEFLGREFFRREAEVVAPELVGALLVRELGGGLRKVARIVEVEAYLNEGDEAAHHARYGRTASKEAVFGDGGTIYIHAMRAYVGMDLVTGVAGTAGSVLVRGAVALEGFRNEESGIRNLLMGPGKLCRGLEIGREFNGLNVCDEGCGLRVVGRETAVEVVVGARVGISRSVELPLRFRAKK